MFFRRAFPFGTALLFALFPGACFAAAAGTPVRTDAHGDPLPPGALLRLGTVRWRACARFLAFLPDDKTLLTGEYTGGNVRCWDTATGKEGASFHVPGGMRPVALSPDGKTLAVDATQELQHAVLLVGVPDGKEIRRIETATTVPGANLCFLRLDFSPDGKTLAAVGNDRVVRLFDVETGKTIFCRAGVDGNRFSTAFSPDGKRLAFTDAEDTLRILEIAAEKEVFKQRLGGGNCLLQNMSFSADGKKVAWRGEDEKTFALWDIASGEPVLQFHGPSEMVEVVHFSPDGTHIAARYSGENGETVRVWDAATGKELRKLVAPSRFAGPLAFSPDGKRLAACDDNDGVVHLWDVETGKELSRVGEHQGFVRSVAFSPDGRTALTGCADRFIRLWDADNGAVTRRIEVAEGHSPIFEILFARDGKAAAVGGFSNPTDLWDLDSGKMRVRLDGGEDKPWKFALAPDGKTLAANGGFSGVRLWDAASRQVTSRIGAEAHGVGFFLFSPDGKALAAYSQDPNGRAEIIVWDVSTGKELHKWSLQGRAMFDIQFSPDGGLIAMAGLAEVGLWDAATGKEWLRLSVPKDAPPPLWLNSIAFSPDGRTLAAGSRNGPIYLWEVCTGHARAVLTGHRAMVTSLDFSPDGARLISGSHDTTALIWDLTGIADEKDAKTLTPERLTALGDSLADADAGKAWRAGWRLAADPAASVPFLQKRLRPAEVDAARIAKLLAALDSDDFEGREAASRELAKLGELAGPAVRKALGANPSPEARRRLEELTRKLGGPVESMEEARALRCVEALEHIGSADARRLLDELGKGAAGARVTREAKAALERLSKREERKP